MDFSMIGSFVRNSDLALRAGLSLFLLVGLIMIRHLLLRLTCMSPAYPPAARRKWIVFSRNLSIALYCVIFLLIWGSALKDMALALAGITVAFVIATKEALACLLGTAMTAVGNYYSVGDRIRIKDFHGDITDHALLSTTLMEVGPGGQYTGRFLSFPNSLVLENAVENESQGTYTFGHVPIYLVPGDDVGKARELLLQFAREECAGWLEDARREMAEGQRWLHMPTFTPQVTVRMVNEEQVEMLLRVPVRQDIRYETEQAIITRFLDTYQFTPR